jgi:hypothetical protein
MDLVADLGDRERGDDFFADCWHHGVSRVGNMWAPRTGFGVKREDTECHEAKAVTAYIPGISRCLHEIVWAIRNLEKSAWNDF